MLSNLHKVSFYTKKNEYLNKRKIIFILGISTSPDLTNIIHLKTEKFLMYIFLK